MKFNIRTIKAVIVALSATFFTVTVMAQTDKSKTYQPNFNSSADSYLLGATSHGVSENGDYAVGFGDELTQSSFIWSRSTGEFQRITGAPYSTSERDRSECYAVSNDGTVVGGVETHKASLSPGYWKDGTWTILDEGYSSYASATSISADSRIISGHVMKTMTYTYYDYDYDKGDYDYDHPKQKEVQKYAPAQWIDGVRQPDLEWIPTDGNLVGSGIYCYHASDDGQVLAINYVHSSGSQAPAASINGKLKFIFGEEDIDVNKPNQSFFFGETTNVSRNGRYLCGYFSETGTSADLKNFVYDVDNDELVIVKGIPSVVLNDGTYYTADASAGSGVMGMSEDKVVTAGYKTRRTLTSKYAYPIIYVADTETAIDNVENTSVYCGAWYNIKGQRVNPNTKGIVISNGAKYVK